MKALIASVALVSALTLPAMAQNQQIPPGQQQQPSANPPAVQPQAPQAAPRMPAGTVGQGQKPLSGEQAREKKDLGTDPDPRVRQEQNRSNNPQ